MRIASLLAALLLPLLAHAAPQHSPVPGGIAVVPLPNQSDIVPKVSFNQRRVMVTGNPSEGWHAVVGIPLSTKPGEQTLTLADGSNVSFQVQAKEYEAQYITIQNQRQVNPLQRDMERISRESQEMGKAFREFDDATVPVTQFIKPAEGPLSSPFGLRRFFNNQPRNPHSGLDIASPEGAPIVTAGPGKVTAVGNYFFNGNTVLVDHGHGLVTMYCHMSKIDVTLGQVLEIGEKIGEIGSTGRVTGPHLHWSVSLNNTRVDPNLFLTTP